MAEKIVIDLQGEQRRVELSPEEETQRTVDKTKSDAARARQADLERFHELRELILTDLAADVVPDAALRAELRSLRTKLS